MKIKKLVAPIVFGALSLAASEVYAANTNAGIEIKNTATLNYKVNAVDQDSVQAIKTFRIDAKVSIKVEGATVLQSTENTFGLGPSSSQYYLVGEYNISNTGNIKVEFDDLSITNATDGTDVITGRGELDNKDLTSLAGLLFFSVPTTGPEVEITSGSPLIVDKAPDLANGTTSTVRVYAPTSAVKGIDADIIGLQLTAAVDKVIPREGDDSGDATAVAIASLQTGANTDGIELVNIKSTDDALNGIKLGFPNLGNGDGGPDSNDGNFTKTSVVISDPITGSIEDNASLNPKAIPGAVIEYTITIKNTGSVPAESVVVTDPIPTDTTFVDGSIKVFATDGTALAGATHNNGASDQVRVELGELSGGDDAADKETNTIKFRVTID